MSAAVAQFGIRAAVTWLPTETEKAATQVAAGLLAPDELDDTGYEELPVSAEAAPELAVRAATAALRSAGVAGADVGLLIHAWTHHQGHDFWAPASFVAAGAGARHALAIGVQQMCNGGGVALELATDHLRGAGRADVAVITTADRFCPPGFDRWHGDYGLWYGDGATAMVLHRRPDPGDDLHLLAVATATDCEAETMHRGDDPFSPAARTHSPAVDVRRTKRAYLARYGREHFAGVVADRLPSLMRTALAAAELEPDDPRIAGVLLPRIGRKALAASYRPAIESVTGAPMFDPGARTGHLGAGDLLANVAALRTEFGLPPGRVAVVISAGGGFSWTVAIVARPTAVSGAGSTAVSGAEYTAVSGLESATASGPEPAATSGAESTAVSGLEPAAVGGLESATASGPEPAAASGAEYTAARGTGKDVH
ncbi:ketoacyl-ACP synthase III family protein [Nocardia sp. alder85J]|uniref:ketoacyl-ACP synthase III family protein n=1 Tax=Nocardia sp. alder85J TaxID=2862949 RepID=UPI001CD76005|nr:ketoacyl-ACP synthase III family protein [Nocardia sp. alder85J]MCX4097506.1 ketoacyl-ACP synthase III family protein [Nocardia sp. alder85J]